MPERRSVRASAVQAAPVAFELHRAADREDRADRLTGDAAANLSATVGRRPASAPVTA